MHPIAKTCDAFDDRATFLCVSREDRGLDFDRHAQSGAPQQFLYNYERLEVRT